MVSLNGTYLKPEINPRFLVALPDGISEKRDLGTLQLHAAR